MWEFGENMNEDTSISYIFKNFNNISVNCGFLTNTGDLRGHIYEQEASLRVSDLIQCYNDCDDNDCNFDQLAEQL